MRERTLINSSKERLKIGDWVLPLSALITSGLILFLYLLTLAFTPIFGDPSEYTVVANQLGFAHPPGYAFITLLGKLVQTLIPVGEISWRMHLLSALAATTAALFAFGTMWAISKKLSSLGLIAAAFTAFTLASGINVWQHAIHANPHIITATFLMANLFFLTNWWFSNNKLSDSIDYQPSFYLSSFPRFHSKWLFAFAFTLGLGLTHHPLTLMAWPAYGLFILAARPFAWKSWRNLLGIALCGILGLTPWLYFPLRAAAASFGAADLNTVNGFLNYTLARGLSGSLSFFSLADLLDRALVFWTLLRLQYSLPIIFIAGFGFIWILFSDKVALISSSRSSAPLALLYGLAFLGNYFFVMSLRVQDIMAYLLGIFMLLALLSGFGLFGLLVIILEWLNSKEKESSRRNFNKVQLLAVTLFVLGPVLQINKNISRVSLHDYTAAQDYIDAVFNHFVGSGDHAVLLNDWEHMTPLWYAQYVEGRILDPADVQPILVSTGVQNPWLENVIKYVPNGPVYLSDYRREIVDFGFRLRPVGPFYQVVDIGSDLQFTLPSTLTPVTAIGEEITIVGYELPLTSVTAGDYVPLTLAFTAPVTPTNYYAPTVHVGDLDYPFTTDSHQLTPTYIPGEIVVERFDFALPHDLPADDYPISVDLSNLSNGTNVPLNLSLGMLTVAEQPSPPHTDDLLANFRQRIGLVTAAARANGRSVFAPWKENAALHVQPGDTVHLTLQWESLALAEESYTVFIHLIDVDNRPLMIQDYTPLGGAAPTHLWIPKWLPGQRMFDPYRLHIRPNFPSGTYYIEVGLYEMKSGRRLHISDQEGNLVGDRFILGAVVIE